MSDQTMKEFIEKIEQSSNKYEETINPQARRKMKKFSSAIAESFYWLKTEIGAWQAFKVLLKSFTWDLLFKRPAWCPEKFPLEDLEDEQIWRDTFYKDVIWLVTLFRNLQRKYGEVRGDEIMARFLMPVGLKYHFFCFQPIENHRHIDQFRQQMADYLGDGKTMRNRVWVSQDGKAVQYCYTRCMHVQIMVAYGMTRAAQASCLIDHVTFDKQIPSLKFKRTKTLSLGDSYCDHHFALREDGDTSTPYEYYEDAHRAAYDAYGEIQKLEKRFDEYGPKLRK